MPFMNCHEGEAQCRWCEKWFDREALTINGFCSAECEKSYYERNPGEVSR